MAAGGGGSRRVLGCRFAVLAGDGGTHLCHLWDSLLWVLSARPSGSDPQGPLVTRVPYASISVGASLRSEVRCQAGGMQETSASD